MAGDEPAAVGETSTVYDLILEQGERSVILRMRHRARPARLTAATPSPIPAS
jgi:hypothetical protein